MKKNIRKLIKIEKNLSGTVIAYLNVNRFRLYICLFLSAVCLMVLKTPYVQLVLKPNLLLPVLVLVVFTILKINIKIQVVLILLIFLFIPFLVIFNRFTSAELAGNVAFFILIGVSMRCMMSLRSKK